MKRQLWNSAPNAFKMAMNPLDLFLSVFALRHIPERILSTGVMFKTGKRGNPVIGLGPTETDRMGQVL